MENILKEPRYDLPPVEAEILVAGSDTRTFLAAITTGNATSEFYPKDRFQGHLVRGMPGMKAFNDMFNYGVNIIGTNGTSAKDYAEAIIPFLETHPDAIIIPMPEALQDQGIVGIFERAGFGRNKVLSSRLFGLVG